MALNANVAGGGNDLTINSPLTTLGDASGDSLTGLGTLTTDAAGTTTINAGTVSGTTLTFHDTVALGSSVGLTGSADVTFNGNVTGGGNNLTHHQPGHHAGRRGGRQPDRPGHAADGCRRHHDDQRGDRQRHHADLPG